MAKNRVHPVESYNKNGNFKKKGDRVNFGNGKNRGGKMDTRGELKFHGGKVSKFRGNKKVFNENTSWEREVPEKKKKFDKKEWRLKKYSKKYKLEQWEEKRKKNVLRQYYKEVKDDDLNVVKFDVDKIYSENSEDKATKKINYVVHPDVLDRLTSEEKPKSKLSAHKSAQREFERIKKEKEDRKLDIARKKAETQEAIKKYKVKKMEAFKKLSRKTKKGQPVMKGRIELMLEKIKASRETEV